jgi:uncharacterized circularly permuted ATP-grasp superfamily protein
MSDTALREIVDDYHAGLTEAVAGESAGWLEEQLGTRRLFFGDRALCSVLRPRFLTPAAYQGLRRAVAALLRAFESAQHAALEQPQVRAQFGLEAWEEQLVLEDTGPDGGSPLSRLDTFLCGPDGTPRCTEYNAETPAGAGYGDVLSELFLALPAMRGFLRRYVVRPLPVRHHVLHALLEIWARTGCGRRPTIAILDWADVPTQSEFRILRDYAQSMGFPCLIADPRALEYREGTLFAAGQAIDLVYKRVLISELIQRGGMEQPLVRAVREGAVLMADSWRCKLLHKKSSLAVLSDERNAGLFDGEELAAIATHVPWTRRVQERWTYHRGRRVDLVDFITRHRTELVLKPNDDYGGHGILLGWEADDAAWAAALRTALDAPFIVQERLELPTESFPSLSCGRLVYDDRIVDTAPFVFHGRYVDGCLTRVSTGSLVNVTAGGGSTLPTFIVEPR